MPADDPDLRRELLAAVGDGERFVSATFTGTARGATPPAVRVTVRPVDLAGGRHLQFSAFDGQRTRVENRPPAEALHHVGELIDAGFGTVVVRTLDADLQLVRNRKGVARLVRHRPSATTIDARHDRERRRVLDESAPFLAAVGITDQHGRVKPTARAKFRQVDKFLEILAHTIGADGPDAAGDRVSDRAGDRADGVAPGSSLRAVDLGCGAGVLTLATYHYLTVVRGLRVEMTGVDTKAELVDRLTATARELDWPGLRFEATSIDAYEPPEPPDLVVALHACDTATDDALARAVGWQARWILAAPCCQHDLQAQLDRASSPADWEPLLRHGIVRERLGDLLTDSLRAELLRAHGYRTDVIEFVSTEHTGKNLMIRAVRTGRADSGAADAARHLASMWGVEPALARRIGYAPG